MYTNVSHPSVHATMYIHDHFHTLYPPRQPLYTHLLAPTHINWPLCIALSITCVTTSHPWRTAIHSSERPHMSPRIPVCTICAPFTFYILYETLQDHVHLLNEYSTCCRNHPSQFLYHLQIRRCQQARHQKYIALKKYPLARDSYQEKKEGLLFLLIQ